MIIYYRFISAIIAHLHNTEIVQRPTDGESIPKRGLRLNEGFFPQEELPSLKSSYPLEKETRGQGSVCF